MAKKPYIFCFRVSRRFTFFYCCLKQLKFNDALYYETTSIYIFLRYLESKDIIFRIVAEKMEYLRISVYLLSTLIFLVQGVSTKEHCCLNKTRLTIFIDLKEIEQPSYGLFGVRSFYNLQYLIIAVQNVLRDPCYEARI